LGISNVRRRYMRRPYETISSGVGEVLVFTREPAVHQALKAFNEHFATYWQKGQIVGWHHRMPKRLVPLLDTKIVKTEALKINDLQTIETDKTPGIRRSQSGYASDKAPEPNQVLSGPSVSSANGPDAILNQPPSSATRDAEDIVHLNCPRS
jgi:hypothetical protein